MTTYQNLSAGNCFEPPGVWQAGMYITWKMLLPRPLVKGNENFGHESGRRATNKVVRDNTINYHILEDA